MTAPLRYSVVLPVYHESETIADFCAAAATHLPPDFELLVCYDTPDDSTLPVLDSLPSDQKPEQIRPVLNDLGRGVRYAIEAGFRAASAPLVLVTMVDLSDDFTSVEEMLRLAEAGASVVCASRYMRGGKQIGGPLIKRTLSRVAGVSLRWFTGLPTHDPTNSFKVYRQEFLHRTPIESEAGFCLGMELTLKAHFGGESVKEVPTTWRDRTAGESRFRLRAWLPMYLSWYAWAYKQRFVHRRPRPVQSAGGNSDVGTSTTPS